jgi:hypothetical protein
MREVISLSGYRDYRAKKTYEGALSPYSFVAIKEEKMKIVQAFTSKRLLLI